MPVFCLLPAEKFRMSFFCPKISPFIKRSYVYGCLVEPAHLSYKIEIFFRSKIIDKEAFVHVSAGNVFPRFALAHFDIPDAYVAFIGFQKIEDETEEGGFPRSVVAHQSQDFTGMDGVGIDVEYGAFAVFLFQVIESYFFEFLSLYSQSEMNCENRCNAFMLNTKAQRHGEKFIFQYTIYDFNDLEAVLNFSKKFFLA